MTATERCTLCIDYDFCRRAYGPYFEDRAHGWDPAWNVKDKNEPHPCIGCGFWKPKDPSMPDPSPYWAARKSVRTDGNNAAPSA